MGEVFQGSRGADVKKKHEHEKYMTRSQSSKADGDLSIEDKKRIMEWAGDGIFSGIDVTIFHVRGIRNQDGTISPLKQ